MFVKICYVKSFDVAGCAKEVLALLPYLIYYISIELACVLSKM